MAGCFAPVIPEPLIDDESSPPLLPTPMGAPDDPPPVPVTTTSLVYFNDFDNPAVLAGGVTATITGPANLVSVQGFGTYQFSGNFARNASVNSTPTTLTLSNLPPHESVSLESLLAIIDSWDGMNDNGPDYLNIAVDDVTIFSYVMARGSQIDPDDYDPPSGVELAYNEDLGFTDDPDNDWYWDDAYNLGLDPTFQNIPHTASTLVISISATGPNWGGGTDESFAIENLRVLVTHTE
jgi:hypothetical protein